jgi:hypothetical protein
MNYQFVDLLDRMIAKDSENDLSILLKKVFLLQMGKLFRTCSSYFSYVSQSSWLWLFTYPLKSLRYA